MKIKICGITNYEDAKLACDLGADAIGFIFYKKSKRSVEAEEVKNIISKLPAFILKVGVFVNERIDIVNQIMQDCKLNIAQLHGDENVEYLNEINFSVVKALRISNNYDYNILKQYLNFNILLDTFNNNEFGGTGTNFKWDTIPSDIKSKIILAGGIKEENLEEIFSNILPYAIDVSSSLEEFPGKKNKSKMLSFFEKYNKLNK
ncbi:MAG: phosphoribosylanthranilate isomerase [Ignavibacteriales bacterium]|nr:phosphoribosylanthranilate isomerase [Ignavibacteriales bacterium]